MQKEKKRKTHGRRTKAPRAERSGSAAPIPLALEAQHPQSASLPAHALPDRTCPKKLDQSSPPHSFRHRVASSCALRASCVSLVSAEVHASFGWCSFSGMLSVHFQHFPFGFLFCFSPFAPLWCSYYYALALSPGSNLQFHLVGVRL